MPGADADTDHNLVIMRAQIKLKFIKRKKTIKHRWNNKNLKERSNELGRKIEENLTESEGNSIEERWKWKHQSRDKARQEYKRLNNKLRRTTEEAREKWWNEKCKELEDLQQKGRYDKVYKEVKRLSRKPGKGGGIEVRDNQGSILNESNEVRNRGKEYVEEIYRSEDREMHDNQEVEEEIPRNEKDIGPEVLGEDVRAAIKELKNNKASGIDNIPAEMFKSLEESAMTELTRICQDIYIQRECGQRTSYNPSSYQIKRNQMPQNVRITEPLAFSPMHQKS